MDQPFVKPGSKPAKNQKTCEFRIAKIRGVAWRNVQVSIFRKGKESKELIRAVNNIIEIETHNGNLRKIQETYGIK